MKTHTVTCDSCEVLVINNIICHEIGCPDAWKDETRKCFNCGVSFKPEQPHQKTCSDDCAEEYYGRN